MIIRNQSQNSIISPISRVVYSIISHSKQSEVLQFDDKNISEFLDDWNLECKDYDYFNTQKYIHFLNYYENMIKEIIKLLLKYISHDWIILQIDFKDLYW